MGLDIGSQLGIYTIVGPLGAGGMGEVYRATDSKLGREVAIKVLPDAMTHNLERVARFEREAKVLAQLNHPMIAAIYGFDEAEGKRFLVLELVEGPTLADRLTAGRLPVEECLDIARQIAEALEVAHEKGIVHRDLKPANVKVTTEGDVKVLDFGLAKAIAEEETSGDPSSSPTITKDFTTPGMILGTAAYMSPEQARGRVVDKRSDIWSFGCVLYECLTGDSMFRGETVTDSVGAILHKQPNWEQLPTETPATVQLLLRRCLAKDRKRRLRDIGDARIELEAAIADPTSSSLGLTSVSPAAVDKTPIRSGRGIAVIASAVLLTAVAMFGIDSFMGPKFPPSSASDSSPPARLEKLMITLPHRTKQVQDGLNSFDVAANGDLLAYTVSKARGGREIFLRWRDQVEPKSLVTSDQDWSLTIPTFSPDGKYLAYFDSIGKELRRISVFGGPSTRISQLTGYLTGATWTDNGFIVCVDTSKPDTFLRVTENGGKVTEHQVQDSDSSTSLRFVHALPGGRAVLYCRSEHGNNEGAIGVYSFETGKPKDLGVTGTYPLYAKTKHGHLLFVKEAVLMAAPFDANALELTGPAVPIPGIRSVRADRFGLAKFDITDDGTLYYHQDVELAPQLRGVYEYSLDGQEEPRLVTEKTGSFHQFSISSKGKLIAVDSREEHWEDNCIYVIEPGRGDVMTLLTTEPGGQIEPFFSPVGGWIYYSSYDEDGLWKGIFRRQYDDNSPGGAELVNDDPRPCFVTAVSADGNRILVDAQPDQGNTGWDIQMITLDEQSGKTKRTNWLAEEFHQSGARISPNGHYVAYQYFSAKVGKSEVYVRPFDPSKNRDYRYPVSNDGGSRPFWSPNGNTLYFIKEQRDGPNQLMSAKRIVDQQDGNSENPPKFETEEVNQVREIGAVLRALDEAFMRDEKTFWRIDVVPGQDDELTNPPLVLQVVKNFFTLLEEIAPGEASPDDPR